MVGRYDGQVGIVLGNGPSIVDYNLRDPFFKQNVTIGSNNIGALFVPNYYVVCDRVALKNYSESIRFAVGRGSKLLIHTSLQSRCRYPHDLLSYEFRDVVGRPRLGRLFHGRTTGIVMLHLAFQMGFKYVFMLGIDGYNVSGVSHFYGHSKRKSSSDEMARKALTLVYDEYRARGRYLFDLSNRSVHRVVPRWQEIVAS